jgi:hypothetical protein
MDIVVVVVIVADTIPVTIPDLTPVATMVGESES